MTLAVSHLDLPTLFSSGQCFRMHPMENGAFLVLSGEQALRVTPLGGGRFRFSCAPSRWPYWQRYFDLETDYDALLSAIPPEETYLRQAAQACDGLRILRQEPFETLISFILSQRKSIPAIRTAVERLARCCGEPLSAEGDEVFLFPTPQQLCGLSGAQLMGCGLGYRTRYIQNAAAQASSGTLDLGALAALPDDALFSRLLELDGVGKKVANCVCLFGYGRTAMAPIDVWIQRLIDEEFGGRDPFPSYGQQAGIVQQYLFYYKRSTRRSVAHKK